jgi:hypothetical protein
MCFAQQKLIPENKNNLKNTGLLWTETVINHILLNAVNIIDSTFLTIEKDSTTSLKKFHRRNLISIEYYTSHGSKFREIFYGADTQFELERRFSTDGYITFEAVLYKKEIYGIARWINNLNLLPEHGLYFAGSKIGLWRRLNHDGTIEESDFKKIYLIDYLPKYNFPD